MNRLATLVVFTALTAGAGEANAQANIWIPPACKLNTKHFLVNSAQLYLKNAVQAKTPDARATNLRDAGRVLNQAVAEGQAENPAVWYFLGRYGLLTEDARGADTAFAKAQRMMPECKDDIDTQRHNAWVPEVQAAADALNKNDLETAKIHFRKANAIKGDPLGFYFMANVWTNQGQLDSAIYYYTKTVGLTDKADTAQRDQYETSVFNLARLYHQQQKWDSAARWYIEYQTVKPSDMQALSGLATVYQESGDSVKAGKLYDEMLTKADQVPMLDLFSAGISLFRSGQHEKAAQAFQEVLKKNPYYRDAMFNLASTYLAMSPRDTSVSQAQRDAATKALGERMLPVTQRMALLDGQNKSTLRMLAMAHQFTGNQDSVLAALTRAEELPFELAVSAFQEVEGGYQIRGDIAGGETVALKQAEADLKALTDSIPRHAATVADIKQAVATGRDPKTKKVITADVKAILAKRVPVLEQQQAGLVEQQKALGVKINGLKAAPSRVPPVTFEFLDTAGQVVASQTIPESSVAPNGTKSFELTAVGQGIAAWRYKVGS